MWNTVDVNFHGKRHTDIDLTRIIKAQVQGFDEPKAEPIRAWADDHRKRRMIFRAMVGTPKGWHDKSPQCIVFLEASNSEEARKRLRETLASLWQVEPETLDWENLESEVDLISNPMAEGAIGDHRLFVIGTWQFKPIYLGGSSGTPLFLLTSELNRVTRAYLTLPRDKAVA